MGRKVHPIGFRLGINQPWGGRWFAEGNLYRQQLHQDFAIRTLLLGKLSKGGWAASEKVRELRKQMPDSISDGKAGISRVDVERTPGKVRISIHTAKPGILIGRKGEGVKKIRQALEALVGKKIDLDIKEISSPDTDAMLVAKNIADQLERRIAYRRAMKRAIQQAIKQGAEGIKILCGGRLGGAEMSRDVWLREGRVPLQTLRANLDFATTEASTTYGQIGIKVWIYKGEAQPNVEEKVEATEGVYVSE
ncbi:MAG: 30S ribosomal protein S3 [Anaerolineales bacterium]|uniref:30S ribosomal protein S3 n=1 Tax=Candidatus Villigracilis saccharophilus TaxID=3140684 RepID=UPI0031376034|nr:30S ribosomal protein S3 [Anaerolineales bacterium]MBK8419509.1 30S ribosomal protein S3 [Anaerolineales bacterium]